MTGLLDIVRLQLGHVIWFSIFFSFLVTVKIEIRRGTDSLLRPIFHLVFEKIELRARFRGPDFPSS